MSLSIYECVWSLSSCQYWSFLAFRPRNDEMRWEREATKRDTLLSLRREHHNWRLFLGFASMILDFFSRLIIRNAADIPCRYAFSLSNDLTHSWESIKQKKMNSNITQRAQFLQGIDKKNNICEVYVCINIQFRIVHEETHPRFNQPVVFQYTKNVIHLLMNFDGKEQEGKQTDILAYQKNRKAALSEKGGQKSLTFST